MKVRWQLTLLALKAEGEFADIVCTSPDADFTPITFKVKIADYPELKLLKKGHNICVSGIISKIASNGIIYLTDCWLNIG